MGVHSNVEFSLDVKTRRLYYVYQTFTDRLKALLEYPYEELRLNYFWFLSKDKRIFYCSFMICFKSSLGFDEEIFLNLLMQLKDSI